MTLWDRACCVGYSVGAHWDALWHAVRGHKVTWFENIDPWKGSLGDVSCENCPDTGGAGLFIWARRWDVLHWFAMRVCAWRGHSDPFEWKRWNGQGEPGDDENMVGCGEFGCSRCLAQLPPPGVVA